MKHNPAYPDPPVDLELFKAEIDSFAAALAATADGGRRVIAEKNRQEEILGGMLRDLARYVESMCNGDITALLSSGFSAVSDDRKKPAPVSESIRQIIDGENSGQALIRLVAVPGAASYQVHWIPEGGATDEWTILPIVNTRPATLISGLVRGTTYIFEAPAVIASGYTDWSGPVTWTCT